MYKIIASFILAFLSHAAIAQVMVDANASGSQGSSDNDMPIGIRYTESHPLVIVTDWNFSPLSYADMQGEPAGYYIDLIKEVFSILHIPHQIKLTNWYEAKEDMLSGKAQLMLDIQKQKKSFNGAFTVNAFGEFPVAVAYRLDSRPVHRLADFLPADTVHSNKDDYVGDYFDTHPDQVTFNRGFASYENATDALLRGDIKYYVANHAMLLNLVHMNGVTDSIRITTLEDVSPGRLCFYSNDPQLLTLLDQIHDRLDKSGRLSDIYDSWFSEQFYESVEGSEQKSQLDKVSFFFVMAVILAVFGFIVILIMRRYSSDKLLLREFSRFINVTRQMSNTSVVLVDIKRRRFTNIFGDFMPEKGISLREFEALIHPEDLLRENEMRKLVDSGEEDLKALQLRMRNPKGGSEYLTMFVQGRVKKNYHDEPTHVFLSMRDETAMLKEQEKLDVLVKQYDQLYHNSSLPVAFYSLEGVLLDYNESMVNLVHEVANVFAAEYFLSTRLFDIPFIHNEANTKDPESFYACSLVEIPEIGLSRHLSYRLRYVRDEKGVPECLVLVLVDAEPEYQFYREKVTLQRKINSAEGTYDEYFMELLYIMERNRMWPFIHDLSKDYMLFAPDRRNYDLKVPLQEYADSIIDDTPHQVFDVLNSKDDYIAKPYHVVHQFNRFIGKESGDGSCWFSFNTMPVFNSKNELVATFGIVYDVTQQMLMQNELREETEKANDSGRQKSIFLANMTHEIRTPLNAISGFAEIMRITTEKAECDEYVNIMRDNSNKLISLIDNILQLSMMDTDDFVLNIEEVDLHQQFEKQCRAILSHFTVKPEVQVIIDTPSSPLTLSIDFKRVMQIVEAFISNAIKYTEKGTITIGYRYEDGKLSIYCADSGMGIPQDKQKDIFERFVQLNDFVQGTGLGLSVCRSIASKMGGDITLESEENRGSTFTLRI